MAAGALTEQDVVEIRSETAAERPVTVWFTAAAVGVPAGRSAKVLSVDDVAEGDFIQVRAAGSKDTMFCSPGELTRIRPPRKKPAPTAAAPKAAASTAAVPTAAVPTAAVPAAAAPRTAPAAAPAASPAPGATGTGPGSTGVGTGTSGVPPVAATAAPPTGTAAAREPAGSGGPGSGGPGSGVSSSGADRTSAKITAGGAAGTGGAEGGSVSTAPETGAKPRATRRTAAKPAEVTVTLSSTEEGEWTVDVVVGKKRAVKPTPVQPGDVAAAAKALPPDVAEAIESTLEAARLRQRDRVERLRAELEEAQRVLDDLDA